MTSVLRRMHFHSLDKDYNSSETNAILSKRSDSKSFLHTLGLGYAKNSSEKHQSTFSCLKNAACQFPEFVKHACNSLSYTKLTSHNVKTTSTYPTLTSQTHMCSENLQKSSNPVNLPTIENLLDKKHNPPKKQKFIPSKKGALKRHHTYSIDNVLYQRSNEFVPTPLTETTPPNLSPYRQTSKRCKHVSEVNRIENSTSSHNEITYPTATSSSKQLISSSEYLKSNADYYQPNFVDSTHNILRTTQPSNLIEVPSWKLNDVLTDWVDEIGPSGCLRPRLSSLSQTTVNSPQSTRITKSTHELPYEDTSDLAFLQRHLKFEQEEMKRERLLRQRLVEDDLRFRLEKRDLASWRRRQTTRVIPIMDLNPEKGMPSTFYPSIHQTQFLHVNHFLPVVAFGCLVPKPTFGCFSLT